MHIINHNILRKIIDIMARNVWKHRFANINKQYSSELYFFNIDCKLQRLLYKTCYRCHKFYYIIYNYRGSSSSYISYHQIHTFFLCAYCDDEISLPNNYVYSSGLAHPCAYKKYKWQ